MTVSLILQTEKENKIIPIFFRFLKERNIYSSYMYNIAHCKTFTLMKSLNCFHNFIDYAFLWIETKEGVQFWANVHDRWLKYINDLEKNGTVFIC